MEFVGLPSVLPSTPNIAKPFLEHTFENAPGVDNHSWVTSLKNFKMKEFHDLSCSMITGLRRHILIQDTISFLYLFVQTDFFLDCRHFESYKFEPLTFNPDLLFADFTDLRAAIEIGIPTLAFSSTFHFNCFLVDWLESFFGKDSVILVADNYC